MFSGTLGVLDFLFLFFIFWPCNHGQLLCKDFFVRLLLDCIQFALASKDTGEQGIGDTHGLGVGVAGLSNSCTFMSDYDDDWV